MTWNFLMKFSLLFINVFLLSASMSALKECGFDRLHDDERIFAIDEKQQLNTMNADSISINTYDLLTPSSHRQHTLRERYMIRLGYRPLRLLNENDDVEVKLLPSENPCLTPLRPHEQIVLFEATENRKFFSPGGILSSTFNLSSAALGAGCLSLPYAFYQTGLIFGILLLAIAAALTVYSMQLLLFCRNTTRLATYEDIAQYCFGKQKALIVDISIILLCFGTCVAYIVAAFDVVHPVISPFVSHDPILASKSVIMTVVVTLIMFPLSMVERISSLRLPSLVGVLSICYLVVAVVIGSVSHLVYNGIPIQCINHPLTYLARFDWGIVEAVSIIMFAFCSQVNVFSIYTELQRPSIRRIKRVVNHSTSVAFTMYAFIGVFGFLRNLDDTKPDILNNYNTNNLAMALANLAMGLTVALVFPFNVHPCRYTIEMLLFPDREPSRVRLTTLTFCIVGSALTVAIYVPSLDAVFQFLGATTTSMVSFILPGLFFNNIVSGRWYRGEKLRASLLVAFGVLLSVAGTFVQFSGVHKTSA